MTTPSATTRRAAIRRVLHTDSAPILTRFISIKILLPLILVADEALVFSRAGQWKGDWLWTADWTAGVIVLLGPLVLGVGAWHAACFANTFQGARVSASWSRWLSLTAIHYAAAVTGIHAVAVGCTVVINLIDETPWNLVYLHALPQFVILAAYCFVGSAMGTVVRWPVLAPIAAIAAYGAYAFAGQFLPDAWTVFGGATGQLSGLRPRIDRDLLQAGTAVAVIALSSCVIGMSVTGVRNRNCLLAGVSALLVTGCFTGLARFDQDRFVPIAVVTECVGDAPRVCLDATLSPAIRDQLHRDVLAIVRAQQRLGVVSVVERVEQISPAADGPQQQPGTFPLALSADAVDDDLPARIQALVPYVVSNAGCRITTEPTIESASAFLAEQFVAREVTGTAPATLVTQLDAVAAQPAPLVAAWLESVAAAQKTCATNSTLAPPGF